MRNRKWKQTAAAVVSASMLIAACGTGVLAGQEKDDSKTSQAEGGSLLDLAENADPAEDNGAEDGGNGLLSLISGDDKESDEEAAPSASEPTLDVAGEAQPTEEIKAAESDEAPAEDAEAAEDKADEKDAASEEEKTGEADLNVAAPAEENADSADTDAKEEAVHYEKLGTTGSLTDGITTVDVSAIVKNNMPSIVAVSGTSVQKVRDYFNNRDYEIEALGVGSGIIVSQNDTELLVVTNNHVTYDSSDFTVCFSVDADDPDDLIAPAMLKGASSEADVAVLAVKLSDIKPEVYSQLKIATLGSSSNLNVGEAAIAIGNALGYGQTVSSGIVSALEREVTTEFGTYTELMIDASINVGCSGGAILNAKGEVIGIVNAKDVVDNAEGMGYGIPIDTAIPILRQLINRETRDTVEKHGYLGIQVVPVSEEAREMYDMPAGAFVYEVTKGSAADAAGIEKGNIITAFDGISIGTSDELVKMIAYYEPGETVTVEVKYADNGTYTSKELEVTLQEGTEDEKKEENPEKKEDEDEKEKDDSSDKNSGRLYDNYFNDDDRNSDSYDDGRGYGYDPFDWMFGGSDGRDYENSGDGWGSFFFGN